MIADEPSKTREEGEHDFLRSDRNIGEVIAVDQQRSKGDGELKEIGHAVFACFAIARQAM